MPQRLLLIALCLQALPAWGAPAPAAAPTAAAMPQPKDDETTSEINDAGNVVDLSGVWFFYAGDNPVFARPMFDDRAWTPQRIPTERTAWAKRWTGFGWYRRHVYVGAKALGSEMTLALGPAREVMDVYINGTLLNQRGRFGSRMHGEARILPFLTIIPNGILKQGENIIALRIYDPSFTSGLPAGPMLLGDPSTIRDRVFLRGQFAWVLRITLAVICCGIALGLMAVHGLRGSNNNDHAWIAGAGGALALVLLSGTGVLTSTLPSLDLALRLSVAAQPLAILCLFGFLAAQYDDLASVRVIAGRFALLLFTAAAFLGPDQHVYRFVAPTSLLCALVVTLYGAHMLSLAARRQEVDTLPVFGSLIGLMGLMIYDGLVPISSDVFPGFTEMGAVGVLVIVTLVGARQIYSERSDAIATMTRMKKELDGRVWLDILAASASAITRPQEFLDAVTHEISRDMSVRRCSLILPNSQGVLFIAACAGLPTQARRTSVSSARSMARWVFEHGTPLIPENLPTELERNAEEQRLSSYDTEAFLVYPIKNGSRVLGVLSVSDPNNRGSFTPADEVHVTSVAERLSLVLERLDFKVEALLSTPSPKPLPFYKLTESDTETHEVRAVRETTPSGMV